MVHQENYNFGQFDWEITFVVDPVTNKRIIAFPHISSSSKFLFLCLKSYLINHRNYCYPSRETLKKMMGLGSLMTVDKYLRELADFTFINILQFRQGRRNYKNVYVINELDKERTKESILYYKNSQPDNLKPVFIRPEISIDEIEIAISTENCQFKYVGEREKLEKSTTQMCTCTNFVHGGVQNLYSKNIDLNNMELTPPCSPFGELTPENQQKMTFSKNLNSKSFKPYFSPYQTPVSQESTPFQATQKGFIYPELKIKYSEWNLVAEKFIYEFENPDNVNFLNQTDRVIALSLLEIMKDDKKTEDLAADIEIVFEYAKDEKVSKAVIKKLINIAFIIDKFTPEQYQKAFDIAKKRGKEQSLSYLRKVLEKAFMPELYTDVYVKKKAF